MSDRVKREYHEVGSLAGTSCTCAYKPRSGEAHAVLQSNRHDNINDEWCVQHRILPEFIVQIGRWDEDGIFIPTTSFSHFVLNKYKNKYKEILLNYRFSSINKKD